MVLTKHMFYTGGRAPKFGLVGRQNRALTCENTKRSTIEKKKMRRNWSDSINSFKNSCCGRCRTPSESVFLYTLLSSRVRWLWKRCLFLSFCMFRGVFDSEKWFYQSELKQKKKDPMGKWKPPKIKLQLETKIKLQRRNRKLEYLCLPLNALNLKVNIMTLFFSAFDNETTEFASETKHESIFLINRWPWFRVRTV